MPPLSTTHVFKFGLTTPPATESLETLILEHLELAAHKVELAAGDLFSASAPSSESCPAGPQDVAALVTEMGDYLARTALIWSSLIQSLIQGPHIDHVTLQILEKSRADTRVSDLAASVSMDVTLSRLRYVYVASSSTVSALLPYLLLPPLVNIKMRDLAEQYARDVQTVWTVGGGRRSSLASHVPRMSISSHDGPPSAAPSVTSSATSLDMQEVPDAFLRAPKRRKQLPDAAAVPRERAPAVPHPPLPPLPLLPPASSLLLPPILSDTADSTGPPLSHPPPRPPKLSRAAARREAESRPLLISTPMAPMPIAAASATASESPPTPPPPETPESVATPASDATATGANPPEQDESDDYSDENEFAGINMKALKQRGKGKYYCPRGHQCDKGGVDKHGNLILFDRNSSFAQHCNKHRKPWRCDVPGCPNPPKKRRFARRDGLERHKATVKHYFMTTRPAGPDDLTTRLNNKCKRLLKDRVPSAGEGTGRSTGQSGVETSR
ncbi:uncharacterized protein Triagg1_5742 [Trichoderma aggressivum f. europaeum]|uniref:Uncharacterized protein n=1 Tax=Trichoderma aggressivum f. europaeum TaxID=173218 RepID=A0AAE1M018_9HYPO|nr:hypothetical protein Triagg1_5742 [Trichoderma aggressivum f. europaeum]